MDERVKKAAEELLSTVREVEMEFKDHRADDDFERMLAELNGKKHDKITSSPSPETEAAKEVKPAAAEKTAVSEKPLPQEQAKNKPDRRRKLPPRPEKDAGQIERENRQKAEAEKLERKKKEQVEQSKRVAAAERERKERETKLVRQISEIWDNPALADGGRVSMTIKTEQRKALRITIPPEVRQKAAMEQNKPLPKQPEAQKQSAAAKVEHEPAPVPVPKAVEPIIKKEPVNNKIERIASAAAGATAEEKTIEIKRVAPENGASVQRPQSSEKKAVPANAVPISAQGVKGMAIISGSAAAAKKTEPAKGTVRSNKFSAVNVIVCSAIFFGLGLFLLFCDRQSGFIHSENRNLAEKPQLTAEALLDGSYFTDLTRWYTDTIPGREELKPLSSRFTKLFGVNFGGVEITGEITPDSKETLDSTPVTTTEVTLNTDFTKTESSASSTKKKKKKTKTEELADVPEDLNDGVWMGSVIVSGKGKNVRAMSAFGGTFEMGRKYADTVNKYRETLGDSINIYTMSIPLSSAYYLPDNFRDRYTSQHDFITNIGNELAGVMNIDVYDALDSHKDEYIYSRTDHHWQPLGAYYAAQVFANRAQFDFPDLSTYTECRIEDFVGTMYAYSSYNDEIRKNPDTFIYHKPSNNADLNVTRYDTSFSNPVSSMLFHDYATGVNCYSAILGTDDIIAEIDTGIRNNRVLVIIKDSFGNALVPYLTHGFEKIYVTDFRYFDLNAADFIRKVGATDLLFAMSITSSHNEAHVNAIGNIRIQYPDPADVILPDETADKPEDQSEADDGYEDNNSDEQLP